ncbi:glycosyltransferase family 4 protein [Herbiconiux sp. P16]|uniref:glycosyltransferase family 4 protein n=1 Tax=Herbiconiux wuyangfengii TaxID=3342794 RepID=UPI003CE9A10E
MSGATVHFVVPDGIDDATQVSGGNVYDRRLREALRDRGWDVRSVSVPVARSGALSQAISRLPDDSLVLIDGLLAVAASAVLAAHSTRLRIVVLAHMVAGAMAGAGPGAMPGAGDGGETAAHEREALGAARRVIATSGWTRSELVARGIADADRIAVARPGTDAAPAATGSEHGPSLLCVGAVTAHKGQDLLVEALAGLADLPGWTCTVVGSLQADPDFALRTSAVIGAARLSARIALTGVLTGDRLADAYAATDLVVAPSRVESYGMVVAEALARGIPVVAARVGGIPEAIAGSGAGILVPANDPQTLRVELRQWCSNADRRASLKAEALRSRGGARRWDETAAIVAAVLRAARDEGSSTTTRAVESGRRRAG